VVNFLYVSIIAVRSQNRTFLHSTLPEVSETYEEVIESCLVISMTN